MKTALAIIDAAFTAHPTGCLAFSGGSDSLVLLDMVYRRTKHRPAVVFCDDQMSHPDTLPFVRETCHRYGAMLHIAKANRTPLKQWQKQGWAMLGKLAARLWMQKHKHRDMKFKVDVSSCCRNMKIAPARKLVKKLGCDMQLTGQRGQADDALRGLRAIKDGATVFNKADKLFIASPLTGWTDAMVTRYLTQNAIRQHPAKANGACTIGCLYCGGGAQYSNSGFPILRRQCPKLWRQFMVDWKAGEIVLAIKYDQSLPVIRAAIERLGGLTAIADRMPHVFDFLRIPPMQGYTK